MEKRVETRLVGQIKKLGGLCLKWVCPGQAGVPDRIVIYQGNVFFVELKDKGKKEQAIQKLVRLKLERAGAKCFVLAGNEEVDRFVAQISG